MKFQTLLATVSILALATPALALDLSVGASGGASTSVDTSAVSSSVGLDASVTGNLGLGGNGGAQAGASGSASGNVGSTFRLSKTNLSVLIDLIETADYDEATFDAVASVKGKIYDVSATTSAKAKAAIDAAVEENLDEIAELHSAIEANAEFDAWLNARGVDASNVIAVGATANGSLAVFTR